MQYSRFQHQEKPARCEPFAKFCLFCLILIDVIPLGIGFNAFLHACTYGSGTNCVCDQYCGAVVLTVAGSIFLLSVIYFALVTINPRSSKLFNFLVILGVLLSAAVMLIFSMFWISLDISVAPDPSIKFPGDSVSLNLQTSSTSALGRYLINNKNAVRYSWCVQFNDNRDDDLCGEDPNVVFDLPPTTSPIWQDVTNNNTNITVSAKFWFFSRLPPSSVVTRPLFDFVGIAAYSPDTVFVSENLVLSPLPTAQSQQLTLNATGLALLANASVAQLQQLFTSGNAILMGDKLLYHVIDLTSTTGTPPNLLFHLRCTNATIFSAFSLLSTGVVPTVWKQNTTQLRSSSSSSSNDGENTEASINIGNYEIGLPQISGSLQGSIQLQGCSITASLGQKLVAVGSSTKYTTVLSGTIACTQVSVSAEATTDVKLTLVKDLGIGLDGESVFWKLASGLAKSLVSRVKFQPQIMFSFEFSAAGKVEFAGPYEHSFEFGLNVDDGSGNYIKQPDPNNGIFPKIFSSSYQTCTATIDIAIGASLSINFFLLEFSIGMFRHLYLDTKTPPQSLLHDVNIFADSNYCYSNTGAAASTTTLITVFEVNVIGQWSLFFIGIAKELPLFSFDGLLLLGPTCTQHTDRVCPYYRCNPATYQCQQLPANSSYPGQDQDYCKQTCRPPPPPAPTPAPKTCNVCPNTGCCACTKAYPCAGSCAFLCPGDFWACCVNY